MNTMQALITTSIMNRTQIVLLKEKNQAESNIGVRCQKRLLQRMTKNHHGNNILGRCDSTCRCPAADRCLLCFKIGQESRVAGEA